MTTDSVLNRLSNLNQIEKKEFLLKWGAVESPDDVFAYTNLQRHQGYDGLKYYSAELTEQGLGSLVLAHHIHPNVRVAKGGESFWDVILKYFQHAEVWRAASDDCMRRIDRIAEFLDESSAHGHRLEAPFVFVSNERTLAIPGENHYSDHGPNKLYAGSFHQWVAYGLWTKERGYRPIHTYYCEKP